MIFEKCALFTEAKTAMKRGWYPYFHQVESAQGPEILMEGRKMIMLGSNNYLGLSSHPFLIESAISAIRKYGIGSVGSRFLTGNTDLHGKLESKTAEFMQKEAALIFTTGMQANEGILSSLVGENDVAILDRLVHASIIDGARLARGRVLTFQHNDMADLERILGKVPHGKGKLIVVDGVYSMEGDLAALPEIVRIARNHGAAIMVDEAHGIGVFGKTGRGVSEHFGVSDDIDLVMGTYSKSFVSIGGFVAGKSETIHYIKHHARSLIFTAAFPPSCAAVPLAAMDISVKEPDRRERLWATTRKMRAALLQMGFDTGNSESPIIPIVIGETEQACRLWRELFDLGVFTTPIVAPAVPHDRAMIRTSYMATHSDDHLKRVLETLELAGKKIGIL